MLLGDRVGGALFSLQDYDLLKCVGDQIAASLLNSQLSQKLLQAKELEAFQTMSAFFVHDLKNTASTLNLMLKNLPVHFDNPAFREDALRGIAKSGQHINNLIGRLSVLRHDLQIHPELSDLNTWPVGTAPPPFNWPPSSAPSQNFFLTLNKSTKW
jgi:signal transduction histidine kinase